MNPFQSRGKIRHSHLNARGHSLRDKASDDSPAHGDLNFLTFLNPGQKISEILSQISDAGRFHW